MNSEAIVKHLLEDDDDILKAMDHSTYNLDSVFEPAVTRWAEYPERLSRLAQFRLDKRWRVAIKLIYTTGRGNSEARISVSILDKNEDLDDPFAYTELWVEAFDPGTHACISSVLDGVHNCVANLRTMLTQYPKWWERVYAGNEREFVRVVDAAFKTFVDDGARAKRRMDEPEVEE